MPYHTGTALQVSRLLMKIFWESGLNEGCSEVVGHKARLPGLIIAIAVALGAWFVVLALGLLPGWVGRLPLSTMLLAVLTGLALAPIAINKPLWSPGLDFARGPILKFAVVLIGLRLSLTDLGQLGLQALPLVVIAVVAGLALTMALVRLAGGHWRLSMLLAVGTAICGASAVAATAPGLRARQEETCYAVACVALIGLMASVVYPPLLSALLGDAQAIGLVMGVAIHDTAQVTAAATIHEQVYATDGTLNAAMVAKLMRNATMLLVIPALITVAARQSATGSVRVPFPLFIVGFILACAARTLGDVWFGTDQVLWTTLISLAGQVSLFGFAMAMAALAMSIRFNELKQLGLKPAIAALTSALAILALALLWTSLKS